MRKAQWYLFETHNTGVSVWLQGVSPLGEPKALVLYIPLPPERAVGYFVWAGLTTEEQWLVGSALLRDLGVGGGLPDEVKRDFGSSVTDRMPSGRSMWRDENLVDLLNDVLDHLGMEEARVEMPIEGKDGE